MNFQFESSGYLTPSRFMRGEPAGQLPIAYLPARRSAAADACRAWRTQALQLPQGLVAGDLAELDQLVTGCRAVRKGESLFRQGEALTALHAVRLGCFKTAMTLSDGMEHVTGFALSGDVLGFDAFATEVHSATATALEDGEAYVLSYDAFLALSAGARDGLRRRLHQLVGAELTRDQWLMNLIAHTNSEPRVAAFLLMLSHRTSERGFSSTEFHLRMSRAEIASYMGLSVESISRALSAFADRGLIEVRRRRLRLLDPRGLARISESALPGSCQGFANWCGTPATKCSSAS